MATNPGSVVYNLGTGTGYSVLEMLAAYELACGKTLEHVLADRRPGDVAVCYGKPSKAEEEKEGGRRKSRGAGARFGRG